MTLSDLVRLPPWLLLKSDYIKPTCKITKMLKDKFTIFQVCLKASVICPYEQYRCFPLCNHSSCSYWLLKDLLQMCFQWKWWRTKSTVCHLKVYDQLLLSFISVSYSYQVISDTFTVFLPSNSLLVFPVELWWKYSNKKTLLLKTL